MTPQQRKAFRQLLKCMEFHLSANDSETIQCSRKNVEKLVMLALKLDETCGHWEDMYKSLNRYVESKYGDYA